jgi:hypothetical protein
MGSKDLSCGFLRPSNTWYASDSRITGVSILFTHRRFSCVYFKRKYRFISFVKVLINSIVLTISYDCDYQHVIIYKPEMFVSTFLFAVNGMLWENFGRKLTCFCNTSL